MLVAQSRAWFRLPNGLAFSVRQLSDWRGRQIVDEALGINAEAVEEEPEPSYVSLKMGLYTQKTLKRLMRHLPNSLGNVKYYEATVQVEGDSVGLIYLFSSRRKKVCESLVANLRSSIAALDRAMFTVYRRKAYSAVDPEGRFLKTAILTRTKPTILRLLSDP